MCEEGEWREETRLQQTSTTWLQYHGLASQNLSLDQLLPTLGFKQKTGSVPTSADKVTSIYGDGLFVQYPDSKGNIYNICANDAQLLRIEQQLKQFVCLLKSRLQWLNSSSRLLMGALAHSHVTLVVDSSLSDPSQLTPFIGGVKLFIQEQVSRVTKFNIRRSTRGLSSFASNLLKVTPTVIKEAVEWLDEEQPTSNVPLTDNLIEAIALSIACEGADAVYLFTQGRSALRSYHPLLSILQSSHIPVNISVFVCTDMGSLDEYKELCKASNGRLHLYNPKSPVYDPTTAVSGSVPSTRPSSAQSTSSTTSAAAKLKSPPPSLPREDVLLVWEELERGRDTLAEIQLIQLEKQSVGRSEKHPIPQPCKEEYMSSIQWLKVHGLKINSLLFSDLVKKLAFQHCEGVLRLSPSRSSNQSEVKLVEHSKLVGAQYCRNFVHLRWNNGTVIHAHLDERTFQDYRSKISYYIQKYEDRSKWLKQDSRELFGTVPEEKVVVVIDTSSSLEGRFNLIKRKLRQLLVEQIVHKAAFNLIQFSSNVSQWRDHLVPTTSQNISAAREWIDGLVTSGSTNTLDALRAAVNMASAEAVYFLTDGRPDQSPEEVLSYVQQWRQIPVHTISFNCGDSKANRFLSRLAAVTGGRYHYYSEDVLDPDGPVTHRSDDLQLLSDEISLAQEQLTQAERLREECSKLQQTGTKLSQTTPNKKRLRRASTSDVVSLSNWLKKNSLSKRNLLLMDALGPSSVPHNPHHVRVIDKHVRGKVYEKLLSTAHISGKGRVVLVNPMGVDLSGYEYRLDQYMEECKGVMEKMICECLPVETVKELKDRLSLKETDSLMYRNYREELRQQLQECGCGQQLLSDLDSVDAEMKLADSLKSQAAALRAESSRKLKLSSSMLSSSSFLTSGESSGASVLAEFTHSKKVATRKSASNEYGRSIRRGHHVIGPDPTSGLYYPGVVSSVPSNGTCDVLYSTGVNSKVAVKLLLPIKGSSPCPSLTPGDYAFVRTRVKSLKGDVYLPGVVRALPQNPRIASALFSASVFGGRVVTCTRSSLVKISHGRYMEACSSLVNWLEKQEYSSEILKMSLASSDSSLQQRKSGSSQQLPLINIPCSFEEEGTPDNVNSPDHSKPHLLSPCPTDSPVAPSYHGPVTVDRGTSPLPVAQPLNYRSVESSDKATSPLKVELRDVETNTEVELIPAETVTENGDSFFEEKEANIEKPLDGEIDGRGSPELEREGDASHDLTVGMLDSTHESALLDPAADEHVLARWMDDGWYYRSIIVSKGTDSRWIVRDANGDKEACPRDDIITDNDDASVQINVGDPVISLHPSFPLSYAPGRVTGLMADGLSFIVELYDEAQGLLPRQEIYSTSEDKYKEACHYIRTQERAWVGKPVIARRPKDFLFHPGVVLKQLESTKDFVIKWSDDSTQTIEVTDMFGELTRRRPLYTGDHVIALPVEDDAEGICHPGTIIGVQAMNLIIQLHNGKCCLASFDHCFWISDTYYQNSIELIQGAAVEK